MKKYKVILHSDAESDIESSFNGVVERGEKNPRNCGCGNYGGLRKQLTSSPVGCPLAPESEQLGVSIRHLIIGRYRVLFTVAERTVTILYVRGPYIGLISEEAD